jgi:hypothetical protein
MFAKPTYAVGTLQRVVATLVACSVVIASVGAYSTAQAANLTLISDTLSDSAPSVVSAHTIAFTIPTGRVLTVGETITIDFSDGPFTDVNTLVDGDVTVTVNGTPDAKANFAAGASSISFDAIAATAGQEVVVAIADGNIVNPAVIQSYEISVEAGTGVNGDTGKTRVAIVDSVEVTAIVETTFDFVISGLATSSPVNGTSTTGSTTATEIPFGVLTAGQIKTMAQQLNVTTNAANGYAVTVEQDSDLISSTGSNIDSFIDGSYLDNPAVWTSPGGTLGNVDEYGHWGLTSSDGNLQGLGDAFGVDEWIAASTTPRVVMAHDGVADGSFGSDDASGDDIGQTIVGYQIEITALQEAADDYNTTLTYIATPTF